MRTRRREAVLLLAVAWLSLLAGAWPLAVDLLGVWARGVVTQQSQAAPRGTAPAIYAFVDAGGRERRGRFDAPPGLQGRTIDVAYLPFAPSVHRVAGFWPAIADGAGWLALAALAFFLRKAAQGPAAARTRTA